VRYPVAGTGIEVCIEWQAVARGEDGHELLFSIAVYEHGQRVDADDAHVGLLRRGLDVEASLLAGRANTVRDGLWIVVGPRH
jgi:hypothetical protein